MTTKVLSAILTACFATTADAVLAGFGQEDKLTIAVFGDSPYGTKPAGTAQFEATPAFIDSINADPDVSLAVHLGDIHSGQEFCTEAYDRSIYDLWTRFEHPLIYVPGDNEWTDCHKTGEGGGKYNRTTGRIDYVKDANGNLVDYAGGDPIANLDLVRSIFFPLPGVSLGGRKKLVFSQAHFFDRAFPSDAKYVENVIWVESGVVFVAINLPGGSNNDTDIWYGAPSRSAAQSREISERTGADLRWLDTAFLLARIVRAKGVVIQTQADMWDNEAGPAHEAAYEPVVHSIASHTSSFGRPVLMLSGDSHVYLSSNPLSGTDPLDFVHPGYHVANFHRIVVHGATFPLEWLKLTVDPRANAPNGPDAFGPFSWQRMIQP